MANELETEEGLSEVATELFRQGSIYFYNGNYNSAIESFDKVLEIVPEHRSTLYNKATALRHLRDFEGALETYLLALSASPDTNNEYKIWNNVGTVFLAMDNIEEALSAYYKALESAPEPATLDINQNIGLALLAQKKPSEALAKFLQILKQDPKNIDGITTLRYLV